MDLHAEGGRGLTDDRPHIRLPPALSHRILAVVGDESLGYADFHSFVLSAIRKELKEAERASYWLKQGAER